MEQENAARALAYAIEQEGNLKDLRRLEGIDKLIEMLAALPDTVSCPMLAQTRFDGMQGSGAQRQSSSVCVVCVELERLRLGVPHRDQDERGAAGLE